MRLKLSRVVLLFLLCTCALSACRRPSSSDRTGISVQDSAGQTVVVSGSSRIVSVGTALTETVYALGAGSRLVGVDNSSSEYLPQASGLPKVGPRNTLNAEGILSLKPTLVVVTEDAGPPQVLDQLKNSGIAVLKLSANYTAEMVRAKIVTLGHALGLDAKGEELASTLDREMKQVQGLKARAQTTPKVLFVGRGPNMPNATMSGKNTTIDVMIKEAGGVNPINSFDGFKEMTDEAVVNAAPDIILITQKSFERSGGVDGVLKFPGVALTPAGRNRRIVPVSDMYFQGFGPGVARAIYELTLKFHPELGAENRDGAQTPSPSTNGEDKGEDKR